MLPVRAARLLFQLPRDCRVYTKIDPAVQWGWQEAFLNKTNHLLELLLWQNATPSKKGAQAGHKRKQPKPFVPDFMKAKEPKKGVAKGLVSGTIEDIEKILPGIVTGKQ